MRTGPKAIERQMRVSAILTKRLGGQSLREIGEAEGISPQAVHQMVKRVLAERVTETVEQARALELMRLDQLLGAIWKNALSGDIACIDRCLAIGVRRARLIGLDLRPAYVGPDGVEIDAADPRTVRVEIIGNPEPERVKWLESERERLLVLAGETAPTGTVN